MGGRPTRNVDYSEHTIASGRSQGIHAGRATGIGDERKPVPTQGIRKAQHIPGQRPQRPAGQGFGLPDFGTIKRDEIKPDHLGSPLEGTGLESTAGNTMKKECGVRIVLAKSQIGQPEIIAKIDAIV